jgi:hypothetical protein
MKHLNWKDRGEGSEARARREVGGYYRISRCKSYVSWRGETIEAHYEVEYRRSVRRDWDEIDYSRGIFPGPGTLAEAKRMAEEDHEQRRRELLSDDTAALDMIVEQQP